MSRVLQRRSSPDFEVLTMFPLQEREWDSVRGLSEGEDGGQEPVRSGQGQREVSRHRQVWEQRGLDLWGALRLNLLLFQDQLSGYGDI